MTLEEVYTAVATAMHKVAALYGKPADIQAGPPLGPMDAGVFYL